ncbi:sterol desaturase family protein [Pseudenhygromyxa sp. WMMC2535]|uniref:sterol desaturase family protein n=1 Tax=Pseudenhygromyxa sp. WMMC2535 TaxID=2712867 RepID=UPI001553112A|nr:sterol desaturase family protein [Pseudenhygromyxa sp. WMMC2535]
MALTPERVRAFREDYRSEKLPPRYHGWRHLALISALCLAAIGLALSLVDHLGAASLLVIPTSWLIANLVEYAVHRGPMHHLQPVLGRLYKRHTSEHHRFFSRERMAIDDPRDFHVTIFPAWLSLFFLVAIGAPVAGLVALVFGLDVGLLAYAGLVFYYLAYEWLHLATHMPEDSAFGRFPGVARARRHHSLHHDPAQMRRVNFNFAIPLGDWLFGTWER